MSRHISICSKYDAARCWTQRMTNYRESTLLRVQIPAKAKFAPICVRNSLLSELFVYIGNVCLHWKKSPVYGVFGQ